MEKSRLGIPLIFGLDVIHGFRTIFPISLAEAASWDPELVRSAAEVKCDYAVSYADAFCVATALRHQGVILTSDPEFAAVSERVQIRWLR